MAGAKKGASCRSFPRFMLSNRTFFATPDKGAPAVVFSDIFASIYRGKTCLGIGEIPGPFIMKTP
ncbi:MAG: hypothetical protein JWL90_4372 [Chthoniobacteraceae bacterium]|nr:hypothetical protein [Chthoniobacteraceae bacterium]